jgi:chorismate dehydratase
MTERLRVGHLNYLNALPLYTGLQQIGCTARLVPGCPSELNAKLEQGELDLSLVSSYAYLCQMEEWALLPGFCIAAEKRVLSVNFYHRCPISELDGATIAVTPDSSSAVELLKILCEVFWKIKPRFEPLLDLSKATHYPAFLLIGDQALFHPCYVGYETLDLAAAWYEKTVLPMTFALFAVRRSVMESRGDEVYAFARELAKSLAWSEVHLDQVIQLATLRHPLPRDRFADYYQLLRYHLNKPEWNGLQTFATLARAEQRLAQEVPR